MLRIEDLLNHSAKIGTDKSLVQGAGGNTSLKIKESIWIKSSGTKLEDALRKNIFIELDIKKAIKYSVYDDINEINKSIITNSTNLRPSIETAMHCLIDFPVVTHVHSLGALSVAVQCNPHAQLKELNKIVGTVFLPYLRPGAELANSIREVIKPSDRVLILSNHGMTVWGDDFQEVENLLLNIEYFLRGENFKFENSTNSTLDWCQKLSEGILTPDELIFLGEKPFEFENKNGGISSSLFQISKYGEINSNKIINKDQNEICQLLINLGKILPNNSKLSYLSSENINELLNWEMEKYRRDINL